MYAGKLCRDSFKCPSCVLTRLLSLTNFVEDPFFKTAGFGSRDVTPFRSTMDPFSSMMTPWSGGLGGGQGNMLQPFGMGGNMLAPFRENIDLMNRNIRPLESILSCDIVERENDFIGERSLKCGLECCL